MATNLMRETKVKMLNKIREIMANDGEGGFTLIELLVVVIIIGILAAIAIPVFLNQRNGARDASVKSDINALAKVLETGYTNNNLYPDATTVNDLDVRTSPGNTLIVGYYDRDGAATTQAAGDATSYVICGFNAESGTAFGYDSANGGLGDTSTPANDCDANFTSGNVNAVVAELNDLTITDSVAS